MMLMLHDMDFQQSVLSMARRTPLPSDVPMICLGPVIEAERVSVTAGLASCYMAYGTPYSGLWKATLQVATHKGYSIIPLVATVCFIFIIYEDKNITH
jgi:hypothetical protein